MSIQKNTNLKEKGIETVSAPQVEENVTGKSTSQSIPGIDPQAPIKEVKEPDFFVGFDSTALLEIDLVLDQEEPVVFHHPNAFSTVKAFINKDVPKDKISSELSVIVNELRSLEKESNRFFSKSTALYTLYLITLGQALNQAKIMVKSIKLNWTNWMKANFGEKSIRSLQYYMGLGRVPSIEKYAHLGKNCLSTLSSVCGNKRSADPIGDFLKKHSISFNPQQDVETSVGELQLEITTAISMERLVSEEIKNVDKDSVRALAENSIVLRKSHIDALKNVQAAGGDVNELLKKIKSNQGVLPSEEMTALAPKHFNDTGERLRKVIESFIANEVLLSEVDQSILNDLIKLLNEMQTKLLQSNPE